MLKPNLLKNSLSANLLKNFRWLIFRFRLNNPFYFVQRALFVFALFNLQGTDFVPRQGAVNSVILARRLSFVKNFFQVLSNFFQHPLFSRLSPKRFDILPSPGPFVKRFFHFF